MRTQRNVFLFTAALVAILSTGCSSVSSTTRRAGAVALGGAAGAAAGYAIGDKDPVKTAVGAVAGAAITHLAMGEDPEVRQAGFDEGYVHGQSDAIKRQYFLRKGQEQQPPANQQQGGETVYYVVPGPATTWDGRKLEPHQVAVRVVE